MSPSFGTRKVKKETSNPSFPSNFTLLEGKEAQTKKGRESTSEKPRELCDLSLYAGVLNPGPPKHILSRG